MCLENKLIVLSGTTTDLTSFHLICASSVDSYQTEQEINEFLVSKETVVLRRWERSKQKFGFIKRVDKG